MNVETFCGECFFCRNGFANNCTDKNGGWALGCRIGSGQALFAGDILAVMLKKPKHIIVCERDMVRLRFVREHYLDVPNKNDGMYMSENQMMFPVLPHA